MSEATDTGGEQVREGSPAIKPEEYFYLKRQAEKMERELAQYRERETASGAERGQEAEQELARLREQLRTAERKAARAQALLEAGLPPEVAELVPEGEPAEVAEYVQKAKRLAERLAGGAGTNTNPAGSAGEERGRLGQLAVRARAGDERALREYAHLREEVVGSRK
jgi:hypothetical protein